MKYATLLLTLLFACAPARGPAGPAGPAPEPERTYAGFDTSIYPGDSAMRAWASPGSPYQWVGFYLAAPCHRDASWSGRRPALESLGWGTAIIYVGQQTFEGLPTVLTDTAQQQAPGPIICSRTLLTREQGIVDADDAIAKARAEGFQEGSTIYLDIERMTAIPAAMETYYRAWVERVLADGHYRPGIYSHALNAAALHASVTQVFRAAGVAASPRFWVAATTGFAVDRQPAESGHSFANIWQGAFDVPQTWNGHTIRIDVNVADRRSPSAP